jgi:hypothetical protein
MNMQPMNYTLNAGDPGAAFDQGFNRQAGLMATVADYQKSQLMMQAQQQKMEMEAQKRADFQAVATNPTVKGYQRLITMYPELHEGVSKAATMLNDQDKRIIKQLGGSLAMTITKGKPESGVALIDQYIESAKNSGDESNRQRFEMLRDSVIANPNGAWIGLHGMMQSVMDGKEYADWAKGLEEAEKARQTRDADVRKAEAEASQAETESRYTADKLLAEIGLKKAQTTEAVANAGESAANARAKAEETDRAASGAIPADKRIEAESKLREEYYKRTGNFQEVQESFRRISSTDDSAAGDISLIYAFMKMNDPGSVVREGEFATAENSAGVPDAIRNIYNKAISGERLQPGQRKMFLAQAKKLFEAAGKKETEVRGHLTDIAKRTGLDTRNIFSTQSEAQAPKEAAPVDALTRLKQKYGIQ